MGFKAKLNMYSSLFNPGIFDGLPFKYRIVSQIIVHPSPLLISFGIIIAVFAKV